MFHSGVRKVSDQYLSNGGRVLSVTALGQDLKDAIDKVYKNVSKLSFDGAYYRTDIGKKGLEKRQ